MWLGLCHSKQKERINNETNTKNKNKTASALGDSKIVGGPLVLLLDTRSELIKLQDHSGWFGLPTNFLSDVQSVKVRDFPPWGWVGAGLLQDKGDGCGGGGLTNSPAGVHNSGKGKIPANQLLFGQRKAEQ